MCRSVKKFQLIHSQFLKVGLDSSPVDPGSSSLDPLPEGIPSNAMTPEQKEGRLADGDCVDGQDHGDANIQTGLN